MPAAGYEIDLLACAGSIADQPRARRGRAARWRPRRCPRRARAAARAAAPRRCSAAAATSPRPAGLAALSLGLPLVLTEADRHLGLTNRLLARARGGSASRSRSRAASGPAVPGHRPPGPGGDRARRPRRGPARASGSPPDDRCLLVFGGSQGARSINTLRARGVRRAAARRRDFHVLHITGSRDYAEAATALAAAEHPERYTLVEYEPGLADALAACDLVLARAGRLDLRDRRGRPAGDPRSLSARGGAPPARQRRVDGRRRGGGRDRGRRARPGAAAASWPPSLLGDRDRLAGMARRLGAARPPGRRRAGRGEILGAIREAA